ncbi:MAG: amino acid carrier protein [Robiginitalea sp.]|uniref:amino acid carrier protein n=1 Tax=Robiginitalea sp. TaxID=1902411 RepID=UPI003C771A56
MTRICSLLLFLLAFYTNAQDIRVKETISNPSNRINDGVVSLEVTGGRPPYTYKWSNQATPLSSSRATGLVEGISYDVIITDAQGNSVTRVFKVPTEAITEVFNGAMTPAVSALGAILFWDPFAATGIYDPVVYIDSKKVPIPGWSPEVSDRFVLKKWIRPEGSPVSKGDPIAIVSGESGSDITVTSKSRGTLKHLAAEGEVIYDSNNSEDIIKRGAHFLADIVFDAPEVLTHPNGDPVTKGIPFIVIWLVLGATFFTIRMGFINIRGFRHSLQLARGTYDDPEAPGQVTHFQALATAVSGTVGLGNIAGVAVAVSLGGAGATFWMIVCGFLGMSSKFVECTLGVKYRDILPDGRVFGGPMNYLRYGLEKRNMKGLGKVLAGLFAVLCVGASFGGGNMFQANQSFEQLAGQFTVLQGNGFWFGIVTAILVGVVIIGGIKSIANVTGKIVPLMASIYVIAALAVIIMNIQNVGSAFAAIVDGAFSPSAIKGGIIGVLVVGFQRAAFSNEAGVGSAAIAHSAVKTNYPPSEGFVALLEPFIDTVVVCTLTALVLIFTGMHEVEGMAGAQLTSDAFRSVFSWFPYVLGIAVFLFAFSTMISWSYYGMRAWSYLFGKSKRAEMVYKMLFLVFVVIGASVSLGAVLDFSDMMILAMSFPNIIGLYIMSGEVRDDLNDYLKRLKSNQLFKKQPAK